METGHSAMALSGIRASKLVAHSSGAHSIHERCQGVRGMTPQAFGRDKYVLRQQDEAAIANGGRPLSARNNPSDYAASCSSVLTG